VVSLGSSDVMVLVYAFGVGIVAIAVLLVGLLGMLERSDRKALLNVLRHPVRVIFGHESPPDDRSG
jgi:hypothetical protein